MTARLVLRLVARDWRAGELRLLLVAVLVAVGTVTAISLFVDRLHGALLSESSNFLAADRLISSSREIPDSFREQASNIGLIHTDTMTFASMVFAVGAQNTSEERNQLVSVKAVGPKYPLRGTLRIADAPFAEDRVTKEVPNQGEVWLDSRLSRRRQRAFHALVRDLTIVRHSRRAHDVVIQVEFDSVFFSHELADQRHDVLRVHLARVYRDTCW